MKISVRPIIRDHLNTLYTKVPGKRSLPDLAIFYALPLCVALSAALLSPDIDDNAYTITITLFGIFIALFLNLQVAIFSVFQRKWPDQQDPYLKDIQTDTLAVRRQLISEINANLSYLVLISCILAFLFSVLFVFDISGFLSAPLIAFAYSHFFLTILMVVKRAHSLFQKEYRDSPKQK